MSKEKLPEPSGWKERLGDPQGLPEWGLADKEAAWDKLHARLGKKPRRVGAAWYWAAACCLVVAGAAILLREKYIAESGLATRANSGRSVQKGQARDAVVVGKTSNGHEGQSSDAAGQRTGVGIQEQDRVIGKRPFFVSPRSGKPDGISKTFAPGHLASLPKRASIPGGARVPVRASIPVTAGDTGFPLTGPIDPLSDSPIRIAKLEPWPVKPLRVVHVNELDQPSGSSSSLAGNSSSLRWLKWGRVHSSDTGLYSGQEDPVRPVHPIITIHLSPQN